MLKPRALAQVLAQANTDNVLSTLLLNHEGALLAYAGVDNKENKDARVTAAIASNIWTAYDKNAKLLKDPVEMVIVECEALIYLPQNKHVYHLFMDNDWRNLLTVVYEENGVIVGNVVIAKLANFILCSYAKESVGLGLLKAKAQTLIDFLQEPLKQVMVSG